MGHIDYDSTPPEPCGPNVELADSNVQRGEACIAARRRLQAGALDLPVQMRHALVVLLDDTAHAFEAAANGYRFTIGEDRRFGNMYYLAESIPPALQP